MFDNVIRELEFQLLCQRHRDDVFRYARSMLDNASDAEDATQETLLRLWNHLPRINLFHVRGWLFRTARNYCLDCLRRRTRPAFSEILPEDEAADDWPDPLALDPSQAADNGSRLELARAALLKLPETLRSTFVLYEVNGLRYREIASILGMPINTVKVNLLRARQKLSRLVTQEAPSWKTPCNS